jgi:hypothetical protein
MWTFLDEVGFTILRLYHRSDRNWLLNSDRQEQRCVTHIQAWVDKLLGRQVTSLLLAAVESRLCWTRQMTGSTRVGGSGHQYCVSQRWAR